MSTKTFHLIANAHLDPVWLWDWREGLNEGIITCRAILNLMDENPDLTFIRGEAAIYEHIERTEPETFARIAAYVESGRWDVVGGTFVQPDTNLPATETIVRHFTRGLGYFADRFGKRPTVAWWADSFGHPAGVPEILAAAGMRGFAYTRPRSPVGAPAFWWEGPSGKRVLAYRPMIGWYGTDRIEIPSRLDQLLAESEKYPNSNIGVFYGVGNHGGGPTRRQIADIKEWAAKHPEIEVVHSGLHRLFEALYTEAEAHGDDFFPTHRGEINYCLRGCYSSAAKFKYLYRKAEAIVTRAETSSTIVNAALTGGGTQDLRLSEAWDAVLFNSFHDILPGSSIERAYDDQIAWTGAAIHKSQAVELDALNLLSRHVDTTVPTPSGDDPSAVAILVWNPHPFAVTAPVELEASLDYRPLANYHGRPSEVPIEVLGPTGQPVAFQEIRTEHASFPQMPWRKRVVTTMDLPPFGWATYQLAYREGAASAALDRQPAVALDGGIDNGIYRIEAEPHAGGIRVFRNGQPVFRDLGLTASTIEDPFGSWGDMTEAAASLDPQDVRHAWHIDRSVVLEEGPERAAIWVRLVGGMSVLDLTLSLTAGRDAVDVSARLLWDERSARLKLIMPVSGNGPAEYDVPGATCARGDEGEVPGGRWVRVPTPSGAFGFASDSLYNFNYREGILQATIARGSRYAADVPMGPNADPWAAAVDRGELRFNFVIAPGDGALPELARVLEAPIVTLAVPPAPGPLPRSGTLGGVEPPSLQLLALKPAEDGSGLILRLQNRSTIPVNAAFDFSGITIPLGEIESGAIRTWRLASVNGGIEATATDATV